MEIVKCTEYYLRCDYILPLTENDINWITNSLAYCLLIPYRNRLINKFIFDRIL